MKELTLNDIHHVSGAGCMEWFTLGGSAGGALVGGALGFFGGFGFGAGPGAGYGFGIGGRGGGIVGSYFCYP